jgi:hypothetical protein
MQPRQLLIVAIAALVAFGAAFGIAKAGGGDESNAAGGLEPAEAIEIGDANVSAGLTDEGRLPALRLPEKKPESNGGDTPAASTGPTPTVAPSTDSSAGSTGSSSGSTGTTQPSSGSGSQVTGGEE